MPIYPYIKSGKEHWYYAFEVKAKNGERKTIKERGFTGKTAARAAENSARVAWRKGQHLEPSKTPFGEYMSDWLSNKQNLSEQSRYNNESIIKIHIAPHPISQVTLTKLTVTDIEIFIKALQSKKLSSGTVKKIFNLIGTALKAAAKKEIIAKSPIDLLDTKPTVHKSKMNYWSANEAKAFLGGFDHRNKIIFTLAIHCGMRMGEIIGLDRNMGIDLDNRRLHIRQIVTFNSKLKSGAKTTSGNRSISISAFVAEEIRKHLGRVLAEKEAAGDDYHDHGLLICRPNGDPCSTASVREVWYKLLKKTKARRIRFHDLRHTCASLLLSAEVHPKIVQELLGHSSIKITLDLYSHLMPSMHADAVNVMEQMLR